MNKVALSGKAGIAVIESAGEYQCLEIETGPAPRRCGEIVLRLLEQQANDLEEFETGDVFPFPSVWTKLELAYLSDSAFVLILTSLDRSVTNDLRRAAASEADDLLTREFIRSSVRSRLLSSPFPVTHADLSEITGHTRVYELIKDARERSGEIQAVIDQWEIARLRHGIDQVLGAGLREVCVREGLFAMAVDSISLGSSGIIDQYSISERHESLLKHASFLETWLDGVRRQIEDVTPERALKPPLRKVPIETLLLRCGVSNVKSALQKVVPDLTLAFKRLKDQYERRPELVGKVCFSPTFFVSIIRYAAGRDDGLLPEHQKLHQFICSLATRNSPYMGDVSPIPRYDRTFDNALDDVHNERLLILSFMFGVGVRREELGIIPLGRQEAIGFVFHRRNERVANLVKTFSPHLLDPSGEIGSLHGHGGMHKLLAFPEEVRLVGTNFSPADGQRFIVRLVQTVKQIGGKIRYPNSYSMKDMINNVLLKQGHNPALRDIMEADPDPSKDPIFPQDDYDPKRDEALRKQIFAFDPCELRKIERFMANSLDQYTVVCVRHGLDIPVGLGFSLAMLPSLLIEDVDSRQPIWKLILDEAREVYLQPDIVENHARGGIKLDASFDPLPRFLAEVESEERRLWRDEKE